MLVAIFLKYMLWCNLEVEVLVAIVKGCLYLLDYLEEFIIFSRDYKHD